MSEKELWGRVHRPLNLSGLKQRIFTIENYFENVNDIRKYCLTKQFNPPEGVQAWKGFKTEQLSENNLFEKSIIEKIKTTLTEELPNENVSKYRFESYFQCMFESTKDTFEPSFEENPLHRDAGYHEYAGVIYLNPDVDSKYGTNVNGEFVENVYNRFVCYPAHCWHGPADMFGDKIENARMTLVFFLYQNLKEYGIIT